MQTARVRLAHKGTFSKAERRAELVRAMPRQRKSRVKAQQITRINNQEGLCVVPVRTLWINELHSSCLPLMNTANV